MLYSSKFRYNPVFFGKLFQFVRCESRSMVTEHNVVIPVYTNAQHFRNASHTPFELIPFLRNSAALKCVSISITCKTQSFSILNRSVDISLLETNCSSLIFLTWNDSCFRVIVLEGSHLDWNFLSRARVSPLTFLESILFNNRYNFSAPGCRKWRCSFLNCVLE